MTINGSLYDLKENKIKNSHILLLIKNKRNADLLSNFLDNNYISHLEYENNIKYDLILVDSYNYKTKYKLIKEIKVAQQPVFLPVVLMHDREDAIDYTSIMTNIADEYILIPVKKDVLKQRVKRMLKTRELTKDNYLINNKYKKIFDNIDEMLFIHMIDFEKEILYHFSEINNKVIDKTGYSKKELLNMSPKDLVCYDRDLHFFKYYFNKLTKENEVIIESEIINKTGQRMDVEINSKIIELEGKKHVLTIMKEI